MFSSSFSLFMSINNSNFCPQSLELQSYRIQSIFIFDLLHVRHMIIEQIMSFRWLKQRERDMHDYEAIQQKRNKLSGLKMGWYNLVLFVDHILELKKGCLQDVQQVIYRFRMVLWWLALFF